MTAEPCPVCGSQAVNTVGPVYGGMKRTLWRRRSFEEALYRWAEGHVYAVRTEGGSVTTEAYDSIADWLERKTGTERPERPPGF